jgi:tRNA(adenine34) deaminase
MSIFDNPDEFYMREALREARAAAAEGEVPIGAVVVCGDHVIGRAHNQTERLHDTTAHAEMLAFTAASEHLGAKYLNDCTLYVTVEPCPMCAGAAGWTQVGRIVYGAPDPKRGYTLLTGPVLHPKTEVTGGVLADECGELVKAFFKKKR